MQWLLCLCRKIFRLLCVEMGCFVVVSLPEHFLIDLFVYLLTCLLVRPACW